MIYLGSPYSHPDPLIMKTRFMLAEQCTAELLQQGLVVFSPIVHCHELAHKYNLPTDFAFWQMYCLGMLRLAAQMYILQIPGVHESKGLQAEIKFARHAGIPICFVNEEGKLWDA